MHVKSILLYNVNAIMDFQINVMKPVPVGKILVVCCYTLALQLVWVRSHRLPLAP